MVALALASRPLHRPWVQPPTTVAAYLAWLQKRRPPRHELLLICRHSDNAIVANFNISEIVRGAFSCGFLGYWIGAPFQKQGYAEEGLRLVMRYAFTDLKLHRLEANIQPENEASRTLVQRAGFEKEGYSPRYLKISGRWRDHERWAVRSDA
jgi:ribosomal-protein-alanine N-acetyltransferase